MDTTKVKHTKEAIRNRGEVFTPTIMVNEMLDRLPKEVFTDPKKKFMDNSCGDGQFLFEVLRRKILANPSNGGDLCYRHHKALKTIFGVELDLENVKKCRRRLLGSSTNPELQELVRLHIVCADALDPQHPGWGEVGFYWCKLYPD